MRLKNFDSVFQHVQGEEGPQPRQGDEERDLGKDVQHQKQHQLHSR